MTVFTWLNPKHQEQDHCFYQSLQEKLSTEEIKNLNAMYCANKHDMANQLHQTIRCSDFAKQTILQRPQYLIDLLDKTNIKQAKTLSSYLEDIIVTSDSTLFEQKLRQFRKKNMLRIIWRDVNRIADLPNTTKELSFLAESSIQASLAHHFTLLCEKYGTPRNSDGVEQPLLILGMGKLGAYELNLSSDIDLIFAYPERGQTDHPTKPLDNQEFFTRLGKKIIHSLDAQTADGFVFRVDMRLRPYGQSGPLVCSFNALEDYYQTQGREWERYAMVKARIVANTSNPNFDSELMTLLRNFTYRKYIDFSVIDALRSLKIAISQEVSRRNLHDDVKLGAGGIREIEFITQAFQLIRGGREPELQDNRLLHILPLLESRHCLPVGAANTLIEAYYFLRNSEHAIQAFQDKQTQKLPTDTAAKNALILAMNFDNWDSYYNELNRHRANVSNEFNAVISSPEDKDEQHSTLTIWQGIWHDAEDIEHVANRLAQHNFDDATDTARLLEQLQNTIHTSAIHAAGKSRLDQLMPLLLSRVSECSQPSITAARIIPLIRSILRRSAYLLLLIENPAALNQLVKLSDASPWIAKQLAERPALLDELIDPRSLFQLPNKEELLDELRRIMLRITEDDLGEQMDALRNFRSSHVLRVAACEITGVLPLMKVSDYLTYIAEAILETSLQLCWQTMVKKHGYPDNKEQSNAPFIIIGYGKLGGIELSHGSDLDLVFIHNANINGESNGEKVIDNQTFFARLGQKIIHMLNTRTAAGELYEVDMRLRPSGNSGLLTSSLTAFEKYQNENAWTWEHQALVRARVVAGDSVLAEDFNRTRRAILSQHRNLETLKKDVIDMREKMRNHLGSDIHNDGSKAFHLKQDTGGIVDIEFMVQYAVLAWSQADPALLTYTDNIRILECLAQSSRLSTAEVDQLIEAYKAFRSVGHRLTLQQKSNLVGADELVTERTNVRNIWNKWLTQSDHKTT